MAGELVARTLEIFHSDGWEDISADGLNRDPVTASGGTADEGGSAGPGSLGFSLRNGTSVVEPSVSARYALRNPHSDLYGLIGANTPVRLSAGLVGGSQVVRRVGEIVKLPPRWDVSGNDRWVPTEAAGILRRIGLTAAPLESPLRRYFLSMDARPSAPNLVAYVPLTDGTDTGRTTNLIPGLTGIRYGNPLPDFGQDDSLAGSRPLPEWPVTDYFGWSIGGVVAAHTPPWAVYVAARLPAGSGQTWLCEWKTDGTYTDWSLKTSPAGLVQVVASNDTTSVTHTSTLAAVDDNAWRLVGAVVSQSGGSQVVDLLAQGEVESFNSTATVGRVTRIRPRPMFAVTSGKAAIGLGHAAVAADPSRDDLAQPVRDMAAPPSPLDGWDGEMAGYRAERLCVEVGVPFDSSTVPFATDAFGRSVADGWDTADTGQAWTLSGTAAASDVDGSIGTIIDAGGSGQFAVLAGVDEDDVDVQCRVQVDTLTREVGLVARWSDSSNYYAFELDSDAGSQSVDIWRISGGSATLLDNDSFTIAADTWYQVRCRLRGNRLQLKVWPDSEPQPGEWQVIVHDTNPTEMHTTGTVGCGRWGASVGRFDDFSAGVPYRSAPLGPQQPGDFLDILDETAKVEAGQARAPVLVEQHNGLGLRFNALSELALPRDADLELDYEEGQLAPPLDPTPDDVGLTNDATAVRRDGGSYRSVVDDGPKGVDTAGRYARSETFGVVNETVLPDVARHWTLHGTWDEDRYPIIRVDIRSLSTRTDGATKVAQALALREGSLVRIVNTPAEIPGPVDQIVLGVSETITTEQWHIDLHTTAAGPFRVGVWASEAESPDPDEPKRWAPYDSRVDSSFAVGTDTALDVEDQTGGNDLWSTSADTPFDVRLTPTGSDSGGVRLRVTAVGSPTGAVQTLTVDQTPINDTAGVSAAAGWRVTLWTPGRWALW